MVTSIDKVPFCCHADLLLMNREQLLVAASVLNEKLPAALHIDTDRSNSYIRNSIEFIVGLRNNPPDAPTKPATPSRKFVPSSPISPLAKHSHSQNSQLVVSPSLLGDVTEEEEPEEHPDAIPRLMCGQPPLKRRKLIQEPVSPTPPRIQPCSSTLRNLGSTHTRRVTRSQSTYAARSLQPPCGRILRSHSQRVNSKSPIVVTPHLPLASFNTPKGRVHTPRVQLSSISTSPSCPLAESSASDTSSPARRTTRHEYRRESSVEREVGMVTGLQNMNIPSVRSDD